MRLLFLTPHVPSPPSSGGAMRMHGLISNLAVRHELAILTFDDRRVEATESVEGTGQYARLVVTVGNPELSASNRKRRIKQLWTLFGRRSYERRTYGRPSMQRALERICERWRPDAIVVEFAQMGFFKFPANVPVVLDAHNIEHEIVRRTAAVEGGLARRLYGWINGHKLKREEAELARRVDSIAVTSERDGAEFSQLAPGIRLPIVVPNAVDCEAFQPIGERPAEPKVLFFGALDYHPNVDAVLYFYRHIWPQLAARHADLRFTIVGRKPPPEIQALGGDGRVVVPGMVEDIREAIACATVVVVPVRAGSGTRLKILEALAMGRPVVTTSIGAEGLEVVDGEHLLVADAPDEFADAVSTLLESDDVWRRLADSGRELVERRYDWRQSAAALERTIEAAVQLRQR